MSSSALTVLLNVAVPGSVLTRVRDISPRINVITEAEFRARPACLSEADVLYTQRIAPDRVAAAQRLRWVQTFGAGVEWLLTPNLRRREDLVVTTPAAFMRSRSPSTCSAWC
jgi:phosphoglycerate dehydrogenase-like enzyme